MKSDMDIQHLVIAVAGAWVVLEVNDLELLQ